jgi:hypothetical protein
MQLKSKFFFLPLATAAFLLSVNIVYAHPGNTDSAGCHTCRTNCPSWGLSYGEYHCHTPKYTTPTCPLFSSYNSLSGSCECNYGYISSGGRCISRDESCRNQLGFSSRYNSLTNSCECSYGYVIGSTGECISGNSFCWNKYGYNSSFNSLYNNCECNYGYILNQSGNKCISDDESCQEQYGYGSKATYGDKCECKSGYSWQGNRCVLDSYEPIIIPPVKLNSPTPTIKLKLTSTPRPENLISPTPTSGELDSIKSAESATETKIEKSSEMIQNTFKNKFWEWLKRIFRIDKK